MSRYRRDLFPVSIYHGFVANNPELKNLLLPLIQKTKDHKEASEPPEGWSTNKLKTSFSSPQINKFVFGDNNDNLEDRIKVQYVKTLDGFFDKPWEIELSEIWFNYYEHGEWQESHRHIGSGISGSCHFACVHFLVFDPEEHQPLTFNDPLDLHRAHGFEMESARVPESINMKVREGDLIMFPAWLEHEVLPGDPTPGNPRITIAFNVTVNQYGEEDT